MLFKRRTLLLLLWGLGPLASTYPVMWGQTQDIARVQNRVRNHDSVGAQVQVIAPHSNTKHSCSTPICHQSCNEDTGRLLLPSEKMVSLGVPLTEDFCKACGLTYPIFPDRGFTDTNLSCEAGNGMSTVSVGSVLMVILGSIETQRCLAVHPRGQWPLQPPDHNMK